MMMFAALALVLCASVVKARIGSGVSVLTDQSFDKFMQGTSKCVVSFYDDLDQQAQFAEALREVRSYGSQVTFAKVDASQFPELGKRFVPNERYPQFVWFRHGKPTGYHRALREAKYISAFAMALDRDPVLHVQGLQDLTFNPVVFAQMPKASPAFKILDVVAAKHMDTVAFAHAEAAGVNISWIYDDKVVETYEGEGTVEDLEHWINKRLTISEDIPEPVLSKDGEVTVVVGDTFEDIVLRPDKDVLLLAYAPWVGLSRKVFPVWNELSRKLAHVEHLVVAKIDGSRNLTPLLPSEGFPAIFLFRAGNQTAIPFRGTKTVDELVDFLHAQGSKSFEVFDATSLMQRDLTFTKPDL